MDHSQHMGMEHPGLALGAGWYLSGMAQAFPVVTFGALGDDDNPLHDTGWYLTQPAIMTHLEGFEQRVTDQAQDKSNSSV
jgi:hypothetical protein